MGLLSVGRGRGTRGSEDSHLFCIEDLDDERAHVVLPSPRPLLRALRRVGRLERAAGDRVERDEGGGLVVEVESEATVVGCPACGVVAHGHGRVVVGLVDAPAMGRPVRIRWRKRRGVFPDTA